ncbi:hypothetical protein TSOC_013361 [Tetrabaena socialis]|uniref:Uncharacterized protein n=1 Tax=Tetrabaena socialis TaxID=47790 RepID=A0A2J7ZKL6_9CHLO|nr:hypothetical protein TSOC_013361 [Tetrabaena socialis]|eukprot:PNH00803.1 hypothetical protein TSOC_013361 [Tetrabaena socialis]
MVSDGEPAPRSNPLGSTTSEKGGCRSAQQYRTAPHPQNTFSPASASASLSAARLTQPGWEQDKKKPEAAPEKNKLWPW